MSVAQAAPFRVSEAPSERELAAKYFRGLGDLTRLAILQALIDEDELSVSDIVARLAMPQATVSTHLACLRWCGFVAARRASRSVIYRVADERVVELIVLAHALLRDNAEHIAACATIDAGGRA